MSESEATLVVTAIPNPDHMEAMQAYLSGVVPILLKNGGQLKYRGKITGAIKGNANFGMLLVMNFESEEKIIEIFDSSEYGELIPYRDKGFKVMDILISSEFK